MIISPYRTPDGWAFDDPEKLIIAEPLIIGADTLCDMLAAGADKLTIDFDSTQAKADDHLLLIQYDREKGESWYYSKTYNLTIFLCSVLLQYFKAPPKQIFYSVISRG